MFNSEIKVCFTTKLFENKSLFMDFTFNMRDYVSCLIQSNGTPFSFQNACLFSLLGL